MKKSENVRVLLIGIGGYGTNYLQELAENIDISVTIAGVCDVIPDVYARFPLLAERQIPVYRTAEAFFAEREADLAVISSPIHLHYEQVRTCLLAGTNVLCEKPVTTSVSGAERLMVLAAEMGRFVSVGYQLNYAGDVRALKRDILAGMFGRPLGMKALHAMRRGSLYYRRNGWAGRIAVDGCRVNDSPFNNACAHQFQNMTFLLGPTMDTAMEVVSIEAELYRANQRLENYDTAAIRAQMKNGVPVSYYTTHALTEKKLGPVCEYEFEHATIYYGTDLGAGPVYEYTAVFRDGAVKSYGAVQKGGRMQKLTDAIACTRAGDHPVCTIQCAIPHLAAVEQLAKLPVRPIRAEHLDNTALDGECFCCIREAEELLERCYLNRKLPSELGIDW